MSVHVLKSVSTCTENMSVHVLKNISTCTENMSVHVLKIEMPMILIPIVC